ncbi:MAG: malto-oligosyltrehalose trehalohydrolase [Planctomycetes bacterium]|nr:malto-oligosyltrehalose trehalohydrolase [Planctomycetota bacterium]
MSLGADYLGSGRCRFRVWAPNARTVRVRITEPEPRDVPLQRLDRGYFEAEVERVNPRTLYVYRLEDREERPDPASRFQPRGVHGPSQVIDPRFEWTEGAWKGLPLDRAVFYELHVGTFTPEGTFGAVIDRLDDLKELGVTVVELMPVAQFPGGRNWGYDGVYPFAVQDSYGGPVELKRLVDACHARGLAVALDVVYNHLGPEGNYLAAYGPYFTDRYKTPWGWAINFDGPHSDEVRAYFIENALYWISEFHMDALRLDALHAVVDVSARPFLEELADAAHAEAKRLGRTVHLIAEVDRNDPKFVQPPDAGGLGLDALWNDDFHHSLRSLLTSERSGYYQDFGSLEQLGRAYTDGFVLAGHHSAYRERRHGRAATGVEARKFVVFSQNHDQVGNRLMGERPSAHTSFEGLKLAAAATILSPYVPLLFMGEEYGETAPFCYFVSHSDAGLVEAVRRGRKEEFARFGWSAEPPDPFDEATFRRCVLDARLRDREPNRAMRDFYRELIRLRGSEPALSVLSRDRVSAAAYEPERVLVVRRGAGSSQSFLALNFSAVPSAITLPPRGGTWTRRLDSADRRWGGPGAIAPASLTLDKESILSVHPLSAVLYTMDESGSPPARTARAAAIRC